MYLFFYFVNNKNMKKSIINAYNHFKMLNNVYKVPILAASNAFYMFLLIIPLNNIGFDFSNVKIVDFLDIYKWGLIFLINIVFISTRYLKTLKESTETITQIKFNNSRLNYLKTLFIVIVLLITVTSLIIISFGLINLWNSVIKTSSYLLIKLMESFVTMVIIFVVVGVIFKYLLPSSTNNKIIIKISIVLGIIWLLMSTIYQNINKLLYNYNVDESYRNVVTVYYAYLANYFIIFLLAYNYWKLKNE